MTTSSRFDCSIIIPAFNRPKWLVDAVISCLDVQTPRREIVIVDDGSTAPLWPALLNALTNALGRSGEHESHTMAVGTNRVRYFRKDNQGAPAARNYGLIRARGEYVKFLDDDDLLLPGMLARELEQARDTDADVVVSGWLNRIYRDELRTELTDERFVGPPPMQRGIDDMLDSHAPWTAAALYKRAAIIDLRWDEMCGKAQEWMWAWTVCLSGASYASIASPSSVYLHYPSQNRLTRMGNPTLRSAHWRQYILQQVETKLSERQLLTPERRRRLIQYYYKDNRVLCEMEPATWQALCKRCDKLDPDFIPHDAQPLARVLNQSLGYYRGVRWFVFLRKVTKALQSLYAANALVSRSPDRNG